MASRLIITRGLPASGKTTRARAWVAEQPTSRARVNRDDLREMAHGGWFGTAERENAVTVVAHTAVRALLVAGYDVVCDDTNLRPEFVDALHELSLQALANFEIWDMTDVPVEVCIERDAARATRGERSVGEQVIRDMYQQFVQPQRAQAFAQHAEHLRAVFLDEEEVARDA